MLKLIKNRLASGYQAIRDLRRAAVSQRFRGLPRLDPAADRSRLEKAVGTCPTGAFATEPLSLDMGKCLFCGACERACGGKGVVFGNEFHLAAAEREWLVVNEERGRDFFLSPATRHRNAPRKLFKRSLKLRQVSAGGCNACELELNACSNVNFDMGRYGIEFTASPRHSDGVVVTGPITRHMARALEDSFAAVPEPKIVILSGACAVSGGLFADSPDLDRGFLERHRVDLYIPGCPPHPLVFINAVLDLIGRK